MAAVGGSDYLPGEIRIRLDSVHRSTPLCSQRGLSYEQVILTQFG